MAEKTHESAEIKNYLLGNISSEEKMREIEKRLMTDDEFYQEFSIEESELVQDYADGYLSAGERESFEKNYLVSDERLEQVKIAKALRQYVNERENPGNAAEISGNNGNGYKSYFKNFFSTPLPVAFAAILIAAAGAFAIWKLVIVSSDNAVLASLNKAYQKERPFESRISGLDYAPQNNLRGAEKEKIDTISRDHARLLSLEAAQKSKTADNLHNLGRVYLAQREFGQAIEHLKAASALAPENAEILNDLGAAYLEESKRYGAMGDGKKLDSAAQALATIEKALELNPNLLPALFNKALCLQELTSTEEARKAWREYLNRDSNSRWSDEARQRLEALEADRPQSKTSEEILREFLTAYRDKNDEAAWRVISRNREIVKGKLIPKQLAFLFLNSEGAEKAEYLSALNYAGDLEKQKTGDPYFAEIADFYLQASPEQQSLSKAAQISMNEGFELYFKGEYQASFNKFKNSQKEFAESGNIREAKLSEYWAAFCTYMLADLAGHKKALEELAEFCRKHNYKWLLAEIYIWLGVNAEEATEYSKAVEYHKEAVRLCEEISDTYNLGKTLTILADEYGKLRQYQSSFGALEKSLALAAENPETSLRQKWRNFNTAALIFFNLKHYTVAAAFEKEALAIGDETQDATFSHSASLHLGIIYGQQQRYKEAGEYLEKSVNIAESLNDEGTRNKYLAISYTHLANFRRLSSDCDSALAIYDKAVEYGSKDYKSYQYNARKGRLLCYVAQKNETAFEREYPLVLDLFEQNRRQITEEASRNTFFHQEQDVYDLTIDYEYGKGNYEKAFNLSETSRSRSLLDLLKHGARVSDGDLEVRLTEIAEPLKLEEIRRSIPEKTQIVQYSVLENKVIIWLVAKNDFTAFSSPVSSEELNGKIAAYLEILSDRTREFSAEARELSREIYQILISPVLDRLDPNKEIAFIPDKFLLQVPFAALISPETGKFLIEDFTPLYSPSANVFLVSSAKAKEKSLSEKENILIVGNPAFDRNSFDLPDLPGAAKEAENVAALYPDAIRLTGENATKEAIKHNLPKAEIAHFAGHYVVNDFSPMRSYLLLAGAGETGALSNYELIKDSLSPRAKLIVLSACRTGVEGYYNGEGMIGASRAFLGMGIPLVIASQWQVDSEATRDLMSKFHEYRKRERLSSAAALRRAQLEMLGGQNRDYRKPFYWAAFSPIGGYTQF
jgi:CHAT domain-containing protein